MSSNNKDITLRHLPPGKLKDIKKIFEDGDHASKDKAERLGPPARPPPPSRAKSPVRETPTKMYPILPQERKSETGYSPAGQRTRTSSFDSPASNQSGGQDLSEKLATSSAPPPKPAIRQKHNSIGDNTVSELDNPLYFDSSEKAKALSVINDMYAKVNKPNKNKDGVTAKVSFSSEEEQPERRVFVKQKLAERRKTVGSVVPDTPDETESNAAGSHIVSVAARSKLFEGAKGERPTPPVKPASVKRQFSMRTAQEFEKQKNGTEALYNPPWDTTKSTVVQNLKKLPPPSPSSLTSAKNDGHPGQVIKSGSPSKPPLPSQPPRKIETNALKMVSLDTANEVQKSTAPSMPVECAPDSGVKAKAPAPPKPPRTHAHDDYLKVKVLHNTDSNNKTSVTVNSARKSSSEEVEYLSVKDRISKMQQQSDGTPLPLPGTSFLTAGKDSNVELRHTPPSRPPPPKMRPNSGGNLSVCTSTLAKGRPCTQPPVFQGEGPIIIPVSPNRQLTSDSQFPLDKDARSRHPNDRLPPEPGKDRSLQRFPLRKSYSSECLYSSRSSSLNAEEPDMTQSSHESEYEAVLDPDGYAIPHEFMRLPSRRKHSAVNNFVDDDVSPTKFLTKFEGFAKTPGQDSDSGGREPWATCAHEQSLDKVNKRKMTMVKQKINQAYADLSLSSKGVMDSQGADDWTYVDEDGTTDEAVIEPTELKKRIQYCATVRLKSSVTIKKSKEYLDAIYPQLFEYCLLVGLRSLVDVKGYEAYVIHKFPENVSTNLSIPSFCFPDASIFKPGSVSATSESYSFVMTYGDGSRVYGYCRRIQPPDVSLPEVICIISPIDAFNMYSELLNEIEARRKMSMDVALELIAASFGRPLPKPGKVIHIRTLDSKGEMETIFLKRQADNRLQNVNYESPLYYLGTDKLVKVFAAMLMERNIMLCSSNLSVLTQTVHALAALLYPFQWQHVYIPLLPSEMLDVVCAPMPYVLGVLSAFLPQVLKKDLSQYILIVDLDKKSVVKCVGDEANLLPRKVQRALKSAINLCKIDNEARNAQWLVVAESFLRMFIETVGHFGSHIQTQQDGVRIFQKEAFIMEMTSKETRQFLEWFTETQMFDVFISNHLEKTDCGTSDLFMQRLTEYRQSKEESSRHRGLGAKVKNFGKALKTKLQV